MKVIEKCRLGIRVSLNIPAELHSGLDARVEESVDVDDVLEESPLGLVLGLVLSGHLNFLFASNLDGLDLLGLGNHGDDSGGDDFLEHF